MKSYKTLTDEILQFMPFKMEFLNGNRMFVDALSRPTNNNNVLAINLGTGPQCPIIFDDQVIKSLQSSDHVLNNHLLFHSKIIKIIPASNQLKIPTHLYNNLLCTYRLNGNRAIIAPKILRPILLYLAHNNSGHLSDLTLWIVFLKTGFGPTCQRTQTIIANPVMIVQKSNRPMHILVLHYSPCHQQLMNSETDCTLTCSVCPLLSKDMSLY